MSMLAKSGALSPALHLWTVVSETRIRCASFLWDRCPFFKMRLKFLQNKSLVFSTAYITIEVIKGIHENNA